jgi:hypothetical protein
MRRLLLAALLLTGAAPGAPYSVGDRGFDRLQDAVNAIGGGEGTIVVAPGVHHDCAVQEAGRITFRAAEPGTAVFENVSCEGKAGLVLRGQGSSIDGLVFRGYAVPDGNGAGIRTETGDLHVTNSTFLDSEQGILGGDRDRQRITIDRSTFSNLGRCRPDDNCSHSLYVTSGTVSITHSRFEKGRGGHYVKIRAPRAAITDNSFDDTGGTRTNYMIDLPEGSVGLIARNVFVQGAAKENDSALIAVRAEMHTYPSAGLRIEDNRATLAPKAHETTFVGDWSHERLAIGANRLGAGIKVSDLR